MHLRDAANATVEYTWFHHNLTNATIGSGRNRVYRDNSLGAKRMERPHVGAVVYLVRRHLQIVAMASEKKYPLIVVIDLMIVSLA